MRMKFPLLKEYCERAHERKVRRLVGRSEQTNVHLELLLARLRCENGQPNLPRHRLPTYFVRALVLMMYTISVRMIESVLLSRGEILDLVCAAGDEMPIGADTCRRTPVLRCQSTTQSDAHTVRSETILRMNVRYHNHYVGGRERQE